MTVPKRLQVELTLPIDPPHPFTAANAGNPEAIATKVRWERTITGVEYMAEMEASR